LTKFPLPGLNCHISKTEILAELPKLTPAEREEVRLKLAEIDGSEWLDDDDPLSEQQRDLLASRILAHEQNPQTAVPWEKFDAKLKQRLQE
jgi:putative addiction module component (TIGR02574 family)